MKNELKYIASEFRLRRLLLVLILVLSNYEIVKSEEDYLLKLGPWTFTQISGSIIGEDFYRKQISILKDKFREEEETNTLRGKLRLSLRSFIWHPNFLQLNADGEYSPDKRSDKYIVLPDRTESNTSKRININADFFNSTPLLLNSQYSYSNSLTNRDFINDIELKNESFGATIGWRSSILPIHFGYNYNQWTQLEIFSQRTYWDKRNTFLMGLNKDIGPSSNSINANYEYAKTNYSGADTLNSKLVNVNINNYLYFNKDKTSDFSSFIIYNSIIGFQRLKIFTANEMLKVQLPEEFTLKANYQYTNQIIDSTRMTTNSPSIQLENQLYLSLKSYAFYQMNFYNRTNFSETQKVYGGGFNYKKLIPTGILWLNYEFRGLDEDMNNQPLSLRMQNEEHTLDDSKPLIINNPFIRPNSILIKDLTFTTIYQENLDYFLIPRGNYTEIKRIPGGRIANGSKIFVDYIAEYQASYKYTSLTNAFDGRASVLDNYVELYFRFLFSDYRNVEVQTLNSLKNINEKFAGVQFNYHSLSFGAEYDYYQTNVMPYESFNIFSRFTDNITNKLTLSFNARYLYTNYVNDNSLQRTTDFMVMTNYTLNNWSSVAVNYQYLYQKGSGIDLLSNNFRIEFSARVLQFFVTAGYELFTRNFMTEERRFHSVFVRMERSF